MKWSLKFVTLIVLSLVLTGCMRDMQDQPRYESLEKSEFYPDRRASRTIPEGAISRGGLKHDDHLYKGKVGGQFVTTFPFEITSEVLARGRERYEISCSVCHGFSGNADGMVVQRGFSEPPTYHDERLREVAVGYLYHVITNGFGRMASFKDQLEANDRWAVVAYIRALQRSQNAAVSDVPHDKLRELEGEVSHKHSEHE